MQDMCPICENRTEVLRDNLCGYRKGGRYTVRECASCRVQYVDPLRAEGEIYDQIYSQAHEVPGYARYLRYAEEVLKARDPLESLARSEDSYYFIRDAIERSVGGRTPRILEIGCGLGYLTYALRSAGYEAWGVDISSATINEAVKTYGPWYVCSDVAQLSDNYRNFDFVVTTEVIEHIENPMQLLDAVKARLAPNGVFLLTTPNRDLYRRSLVWHTELPPIHLWWFSEISIHVLGRRCGYYVELFDFSSWNCKLQKKANGGLVRDMRRDTVPVLDVDGKLYKSCDRRGNIAELGSLSLLRRTLALAEGAWGGVRDRWENPRGTIIVSDPSRSKTMGITMRVR